MIQGECKEYSIESLEKIQQSTTMPMTLKPVVNDYNDYICFSYYELLVMDT